MKTIGLITEYNPFHNGHLHQIRTLREMHGKDTALIAVMSGDWVQRGGPALLDKWSRTRAALAAGVDLVIELPAIFATGSAPYFAGGAIRLLQATGVCRRFACGAETPEPKAMKVLAALMLEEPPLLREKLQEALKEGQPYAAAWSLAANAFLTEQPREDLPLELQHQLMSGSNNWLALEYIKASLRSCGSGMRFDILPRLGSNYLEAELSPQRDGSSGEAFTFDSATALRHFVSKSLLCDADSSAPSATIMKELAGRLPSTSLGEILAAIPTARIAPEGSAGPLAYSLLRSRPAADLTCYDGITEDLAARLARTAAALQHIPPTALWSSLLDGATARNYPATRIGRALTALILGITTEARQRADLHGPAYIRVLGFGKKGRYLLRLARKYASLPIITRESDHLEYRENADHLAQSQLDHTARDLRAVLTGTSPGNDFDTNVVIR